MNDSSKYESIKELTRNNETHSKIACVARSIAASELVTNLWLTDYLQYQSKNDPVPRESNSDSLNRSPSGYPLVPSFQTCIKVVTPLRLEKGNNRDHSQVRNHQSTIPSNRNLTV